MNKYESVIIINPKLEEKDIKGTIDKYQKMMKDFSKRNVTVDEIGEKKLAYEIEKNKTGYYVVFNFYSEYEKIAELERNFRIDSNVMKFITVRQEEQEYDESEENEEEY